MATEAEIERMIIRLMGDASHYERTLDKATKATHVFARQVGQTLQRVGQSIRNFGSAMRTYLTLPIIGGGVGSLKLFGDFDKAMTESLAIMTTTEEQAKRMRKTALDLPFSGKVLQSPRDLAEAYFFLASAGKDAEQSMALLPKVAEFATAGAFGMKDATDLLTDAQSALGMSLKDAAKDAENMGRLADVLVRANTLANASVSQFSVALTRDAGSAFKSYNISLEEGVALLAAYADQGIKAELAGNSAGRLIRLLTKAVAENGKEFDRLNIKVFDSSGEFRRFSEIIRDIENATKGMSTEQKAATLTALGFEARMQQVILPLLGTSDALERYSDELKKASGFTESVAGKQMQSFWNQLKAVWNQIKVLGIEIGEVLAPYIKQLGEYISAATQWFRSLSPEIKVAIVAILGVAAAIGPLLMMFGGFVSQIGIAIMAVSALPAIVPLLPVILGVLAGAAAVAAVLGIGIYNVVKHFDELKPTLLDIWNSLKKIWEITTPLRRALYDAFVKVLDISYQLLKRWLSGFAALLRLISGRTVVYHQPSTAKIDRSEYKRLEQATSSAMTAAAPAAAMATPVARQQFFSAAPERFDAARSGSAEAAFRVQAYRSMAGGNATAAERTANETKKMREILERMETNDTPLVADLGEI